MQTDIHRASRLAQAIIRVRLGLATEAEREFLVDWLDESEQHRQTYKRIVRGVAIREQLQAEEQTERHTDYVRLRRDIVRLLLRRRRRLHLWAWTSVAAAACVCGVLFWFAPEAEETAPVAEVEVVAKPLDAKVKLTLPSGEQVALDKTGDTGLDLGNAVAKDGRLVYKAGGEAVAEEQWSRVETGVGGDYCLQLSDGTRVWLNATSRLDYPVNFLRRERMVRLVGEAYFEVAKDASRPFIVEANGVRTRVLGTSFNIQAYADESGVRTALVTGRVQVSLPGGTKAVDLTPGREAVWVKGSSGLSVHAVDVSKVTAWRSGQFLFDEESLDVVTRMLSRWYGVQFVHDGDKYGQHTFSGRLSKDWPLERALEMITLAGGPRFSREGDVVHVME